MTESTYYRILDKTLNNRKEVELLTSKSRSQEKGCIRGLLPNTYEGLVEFRL